MTILWDADGSHFGQGSGLSLFVDGEKVANSPRLQRLTAEMK